MILLQAYNIKAELELQITSPIAGETICHKPDDPYLLTWESDLQGEIVVSISSDSGKTYKRLFSKIEASQGYYKWEIPYNVYREKDVAIKISLKENYEIYDEVFNLEIIDAPYILSQSESKVLCNNTEKIVLNVYAKGENLKYQLCSHWMTSYSYKYS